MCEGGAAWHFLYSISMFRAAKCLKMKVDQRTGRTGKKEKEKGWWDDPLSQIR